MLTIGLGNGRGDCSGMTRRNFLRVGALGLGGLGLADLVALQAQANSGSRGFIKDRSVVFLYLGGGPSQIETFDPRPDAPVEYRCMTGVVQSRLPGVVFGGNFPRLASRADRLAVVRSFVPANANHDSGRSLFNNATPLKAPWGSIYSRVAGTTHPKTGLMSNVFLSPMSAGHAPVEKLASFYYAALSEVGALPVSCAPFHPQGTAAKGAAQGGLLGDLQLKVAPERLDDRRSLLRQLDELHRNLDRRDAAVSGLDQYQQQAHEVLLRGVSQAFDVSKEDPRVVQAYDTSEFKTPEVCLKRDRNGKMPGHSPTVLGKQMLLARRLCEAGCGFITVGMNDWDMHGNANSFSIPEGMPVMGGAVDKAVSAFLDDLQQRGLSDRVLLVMCGEMGRTPRISTDKDTKLPGRDHWANLGALVLAGGGLKVGQVVGASDSVGGKPATEPVTPAHLMATLWHTLFNLGELRIAPSVPTDLVRVLTEGQPIRELVA